MERRADRQSAPHLAGPTNGRLGESHIGPPGTDIAEALVIGPQGTVYVTGRTTGAFGDAVNQGQFDGFVAWSDAPGSSAPWKLFQTGTETPQHPRCLAVTAAGASDVSGALLSGDRRGMSLRKLAGDGQPLWTARHSSSPTEPIAAVRTMGDGSPLAGGSVCGAFRGGPWQGQQDVFGARISADGGRVLKSWQFGSTDLDGLTDLRVDATGNIHLFCETAGRLAVDGCGVVAAGRAGTVARRDALV